MAVESNEKQKKFSQTNHFSLNFDKFAEFNKTFYEE